MEESDDSFYLRLRGLPWSASHQDIQDFLKNVKIYEGENSILFTISEEGKRSGDALVKVPTREDFEKALTYNRNYIGKRYVEVIPTEREDFLWNQERSTLWENDCIVRLRGLPYATTEDGIREFFCGIDIAPHGVVIIKDHQNRCSGDAYVEFTRPEGAFEAVKKHRDKMGTRFIEVYRSCKLEMSYVGCAQPTPLMSINVKRERSPRLVSNSRRKRPKQYASPPKWSSREQTPYDYPRSGPNIEKYVHLRGLPYACSMEEIEDFFYPLCPVSVGFCYDHDDRFNGECDIFFECESDVMRAMNKDKKKIGKRYAELFLRTRKITQLRSRREYRNPHSYPYPLQSAPMIPEYSESNSGYSPNYTYQPSSLNPPASRYPPMEPNSSTMLQPSYVDTTITQYNKPSAPHSYSQCDYFNDSVTVTQSCGDMNPLNNQITPTFMDQPHSLPQNPEPKYYNYY